MSVRYDGMRMGFRNDLRPSYHSMLINDFGVLPAKKKIVFRAGKRKTRASILTQRGAFDGKKGIWVLWHPRRWELLFKSIIGG